MRGLPDFGFAGGPMMGCPVSRRNNVKFRTIFDDMRKFVLWLLMFPLAFVSCNKGDTDKALAISGEWQLCGVETKVAEIGGVIVDVYLKFAGDGSFELYQMVGQGRFRYRSGSYSLSGSELSGKYSDGTAWSASYEVSLDGDSLRLSSIGSPLVETDSYVRCQIPQSVISEAVR